MEINNIEVINCTYGKAYILDNVAYDIRFPLNWALHPEKTHEGFICGPSYCQNCFKYGTYKGVFIGYCLICAAVYNYERGNGFINCGEEIASTEYPDTSAWNTYLYDVNRDQIGTNLELENELQNKFGEQDQPQENEKETRFRELNLKTEHIIKIIQDSHQQIYQIGTVQYGINFPLHWALESMEDVEKTKEEEDCLFRDVESISSDDLIVFKDNSCPSPKYVETESDDYYDEFEDDYHDYVDSESEHFYVRGW